MPKAKEQQAEQAKQESQRERESHQTGQAANDPKQNVKELPAKEALIQNEGMLFDATREAGARNIVTTGMAAGHQRELEQSIGGSREKILKELNDATIGDLGLDSTDKERARANGKKMQESGMQNKGDVDPAKTTGIEARQPRAVPNVAITREQGQQKG